MKSDLELLQLVKQKKQEGYRQVYQRFSPYLFGVCKRYLNTVEDAEEALSDAFIKAFEKIDQLEDPNKLGAWLKTIVIRTCLQRIKSKKLEIENIDINTKDIPVEEDALSKLSMKELMEYIEELPIGYRTVFNLYFIEGFPHKQIAEMLDIGIGTSKSQLNKARKRLQMTIINNRELPKLIAL